MAKKIVRLTEGQLHKVITESVQRILREMDETSEMNIHEDYICGDAFIQKLEELGFDIEKDRKGNPVIYNIDTPYEWYGNSNDPTDGGTEYFDIPVLVEDLYEQLFLTVYDDSDEEIMHHIQNLTGDEVDNVLQKIAENNIDDYLEEHFSEEHSPEDIGAWQYDHYRDEGWV